MLLYFSHIHAELRLSRCVALERKINFIYFEQIQSIYCYEKSFMICVTADEARIKHLVQSCFLTLQYLKWKIIKVLRLRPISFILNLSLLSRIYPAERDMCTPQAWFYTHLLSHQLVSCIPALLSDWWSTPQRVWMCLNNYTQLLYHSLVMVGSQTRHLWLGYLPRASKRNYMCA